jgi:hypothetical protein
MNDKCKAELITALLVAALFVLSGHYHGNAPSVVLAQSGLSCSLATLRGSYSNVFQVLNTSGVPVPATLGSTYTPGAGIGTITFDGHGGAFSNGTVTSFGGFIFPPSLSPATYTVNSDCTGTLEIGPSVSLAIVIDDSGRQVHTLSSVQGDIALGVLRKQ